jgi:transglutaminase-like putative cysteine protease
MACVVALAETGNPLQRESPRATSALEAAVLRFQVQHESLYRYTAPVVFAPHVLRLNPRAEGVRILSRALIVYPEPADLVDIDDAFGNRVSRATFLGYPADRLRIESRFELETFVAPDAGGDEGPVLPWPLAAGDGLDPYRHDTEGDPSVHAFAADVAAEAGGRPLAFLNALNRRIFQSMDAQVRHEGAAQRAGTTLATRRGACRDITVLFLAACRSQGIPARFVSGYQARTQARDGQRYLHAWAEAFVRGRGWSGWDPTHGVKVIDGHVALCAAPDQADTMPVQGGFYGSAQTSTLDWSLCIATD